MKIEPGPRGPRHVERADRGGDAGVARRVRAHGGERDVCPRPGDSSGGRNPRWYRRTLDRIAALPRAERPLVLVWHTEPLPMPRAAGTSKQLLTTRELGKLVLRDRRVNDHYSNARYLRRLAAGRSADVLAVATCVPGVPRAGRRRHRASAAYHPSHGRLLGRERDVDVIFLGDFRLPRRRRILRLLERESVDVSRLGDYANPELWGEGRVELMNRVKVALNIPRLEGHLPDVRLSWRWRTARSSSRSRCLPEPYVPGVHYVEAPVDRLAETIRHYLEDEDARRRSPMRRIASWRPSSRSSGRSAGCSTWCARLRCGRRERRPARLLRAPSRRRGAALVARGHARDHGRCCASGWPAAT